MSYRDTVTFYDVIVIAATDKALLVNIDDEEVWIPRSQIEYGDTDIEHKNDCGTLEVTEWIAEQKGLR